MTAKEYNERLKKAKNFQIESLKITYDLYEEASKEIKALDCKPTFVMIYPIIKKINKKWLKIVSLNDRSKTHDYGNYLSKDAFYDYFIYQNPELKGRLLINKKQIVRQKEPDDHIRTAFDIYDESWKAFIPHSILLGIIIFACILLMAYLN